MRRLLPVALVWACVLAPAETAAAAPYSIEIVNPVPRDGTARVRGTVRLEVEVSGLGGPTTVRYQVNEVGAGWSEEGGTPMSPSGPSTFAADLDAGARPNGTYRLLVRAWGGSAGPYDPNDDGTYAATRATLQIATPPPMPSGLSAEGGAGAASASWDEVPTSARSDFAGYEVYLALADTQGECPPFGDVYSLRETTFSTTHAEGGLPAARYCIRVRALRTSPGTGPIPSKVSDAAIAAVAPGGSSPASGDPNGGAYTPGLPYDPGSEPSPIPGGEAAGPQAVEAGTREGRNRWTFMAGGLALAILALLLGHYVRAAPRT